MMSWDGYPTELWSVQLNGTAGSSVVPYAITNDRHHNLYTCGTYEGGVVIARNTSNPTPTKGGYATVLNYTTGAVNWVVDVSVAEVRSSSHIGASFNDVVTDGTTVFWLGMFESSMANVRIRSTPDTPGGANVVSELTSSELRANGTVSIFMFSHGVGDSPGVWSSSHVINAHNGSTVGCLKITTGDTYVYVGFSENETTTRIMVFEKNHTEHGTILRFHTYIIGADLKDLAFVPDSQSGIIVMVLNSIQSNITVKTTDVSTENTTTVMFQSLGKDTSMTTAFDTTLTSYPKWMLMSHRSEFEVQAITPGASGVYFVAAHVPKASSIYLSTSYMSLRTKMTLPWNAAPGVTFGYIKEDGTLENTNIWRANASSSGNVVMAHDIDFDLSRQLLIVGLTMSIGENLTRTLISMNTSNPGVLWNVSVQGGNNNNNNLKSPILVTSLHDYRHQYTTPTAVLTGEFYGTIMYHSISMEASGEKDGYILPINAATVAGSS